VYTSLMLVCAEGDTVEMIYESLVFLLCSSLQLYTALRMVGAISHDEITPMTDVLNEQSGESRNLFQEFGTDEGGTCYRGNRGTFWSCTNQEWSWQAAMLQQMGEYADFDTGFRFGCFALFLWSGKIVKELRSICNYGILMFMDVEEPCLLYDRSSDQLHFRALPVIGTFVVLVVCGVRLAVTAILGFYGFRFLAHTQTLPDFVLNCVALDFVFDLDETFFNVFCSTRTIHMVRRLQSPQWHPSLHSKVNIILLLERVLVVLGMVAMTTAAVYIWLIPFHYSYTALAYSKICPASHGCDPGVEDEWEEI